MIKCYLYIDMIDMKGFVTLEKRVYFLKFNKKILKMDLISFGTGLIGIFLGILSILGNV